MSKIKAFGEGEWVSEKTKELDKLGGIGGLLTGFFLCLCLVWSCHTTICVSAYRQEPAACETRRLIEDEITVATGSAVGLVAPELLF